MKKSEISFGILKIAFDFVATVIAFLIAYKLRLQTEPIPGFAKAIDFSILPTVKEYFHFSLYAALGLIIVFAIGKMYTLKASHVFGKEIQKAISLSVVWIALIIVYFFAIREFPFSRLAMLYSWLLTVGVIIIGRIIVKIVQKIAVKNGMVTMTQDGIIKALKGITTVEEVFRVAE